MSLFRSHWCATTCCSPGLDRSAWSGPHSPISRSRLSTTCSRQISLLISFDIQTIPSSTTLVPFRHDRFSYVTSPSQPSASIPPGRPYGQWDRRRANRGSPFRGWLPDRLGRIRFTFVTDWSFVSGCSPPCVATTQLPLLTTGW